MKKREKSIVYRRLIQSYLSSVISISLVLFMAGISAMLAVNAKSVTDYFRENIKISIMFEDIAYDRDAANVLELLNDKEYVKEARLITKEEGANEMAQLLGKDFMEVFETNPIPASIDIYLKAEFLEESALKLVEKELKEFPLVREVVYHQSLVETINDNIEKAGVIAGVLIILLLFISFVLINNTVRLNLYSKRFVVHTMKLVGAKRSFIRKPLLVKGAWQGLLAGLLSAAALYGATVYIRRDFPQLYEVVDANMVIMVLFAMVATGVLLCVVSTYFIVNKLVSMTSDDIYY